MAVLEAVRGWEEHAGIPHINEVRKEDGTTEEEKKDASEKKDETPEEGVWNAHRLQYELDTLLNTDYTSLLLEHDEHIRSSGDEEEISSKSGSLVYCSTRNSRWTLSFAVTDIAQYVPDFLLEYYEQFKEGLVGLLETLHVVPAVSKTSGTSTSLISTKFRLIMLE